ncbi:aldolase [Paenibacillus sp. FSL A5-0031]|uniref:aldolase/citrate lyase family protein n=1 Tax=Paenibacillus sp. FSL A5-0031 TaxID=1920420 RepID=UPI00096CDCF5|nr:aldolase/citrate lyase family protein [Paenibacillus sp. FSL A5-0031]OME82144.1 aldolase [Paenibacillus sp. FSL A5-0031]
MALKLMYITNKEKIARVAEESGVDWVFIDLEINGKEDRQGHLDTVISRHKIEDIKRIKNMLTKAELLVRVNPIFEGSEVEINRVINDGADIVMLPFFKTKQEVMKFIKFVNGRAKTCLLFETPEAVERIDEILNVKGIDLAHIGLNDLHLGYGMKFMFELVTDGTVDMLCKKFKTKGIQYGFGGIARLGQGLLPGEYVIAEHYRVGSSMAILSRSFCYTDGSESVDEIRKVFEEGINEIRQFENKLMYESNTFFVNNNIKVKEIVLNMGNNIVAV